MFIYKHIVPTGLKKLQKMNFLELRPMVLQYTQSNRISIIGKCIEVTSNIFKEIRETVYLLRAYKARLVFYGSPIYLFYLIGEYVCLIYYNVSK